MLNSRELYNLPDDQATKILFSRLSRFISIYSSNANEYKIDHEVIDKYISRIMSILKTTLYSIESADKYSEIIDRMIQLLEIGLRAEMNKTAEQDPAKAFLEAKSFSELFTSLNTDYRLLPGLLSGVLAALNYWPDSIKVLERKGVIIDMSDIAHSNTGLSCDIFVVNDKHLRNRLKAAIHETKSNTAILDKKQFEDWLKDKNTEISSMVPK